MLIQKLFSEPAHFVMIANFAEENTSYNFGRDEKDD